MPKAPSTTDLARALERHRREAREQAEQWLDTTSQLEDALSRYASLFLEAPVGYLVLDERGSIVQINAAAAAVLQEQPEDRQPQRFLRFIAPSDAKFFLLHLLNCGRRGSATTELRLAHDQRTIRLVSRRGAGTPSPLFYTTVTDITDQRRFDQALRESEARYREIVETANEGICIVDDTNHIVFANRRLATMIGVTPESLIGRSALDLAPDEDEAMAQRAFERREIGEDGQSIQRLQRVDGTWIVTAVSTTIRFDERGQFTGMLRMYTDATAREQLTEARQLLVAQLVAAQERERERIARELHDQLGQHVVALSLGLARLNTLATDTDSDLIALMQRVTDLLGKDLHTLALELRPSALDHLGVAAALRAYADEVAQRSGFDIDVHCEVAETTLDPTIQTGLYRIAQEALTNVIKHSRAQHVSIILEGHHDTLQLIVEDDGRGFAVDKLDRGQRTSRLGLAGIRERASLMGGTVTIESEPGKGTTVFVRIPLHPESSRTNEQETSTAPG